MQYRHGPKLELYFESMEDTKHVANIRKDPRVSVAIYWPEEFPGGGNLGLQIRGTAEEVTDEQNRSIDGVWRMAHVQSHARRGVVIVSCSRQIHLSVF